MLKNVLKKNIVKDAFWYTLANIVMQLSSLISVFFVARYLGPVNLGLYSFVQNFISIFTTTLSALDIRANWQITKSENPEEELKKYTLIKIAITLPTVFLFVILSYFVLAKDVFLLTLISIIPIFSSVFTSFVFYLQYKNKSRFVALSMIASSLVILFSKVLSVISNQPLKTFVLINSLDGFVLVFLCTFYVFSKTGVSLPKVRKADFHGLFSKSIFPIIYTFFWILVVRADQFFIPTYFNAHDLGVYSPAVKIIEMTNVLIVILQALVIPRIFSIIKDQESKRIYLTALVYLVVGIYGALFIYIIAPFVVPILFGNEFIQTVSILNIYVWSIPGLFVTYFFTLLATANDSFKNLAYFGAVMAAATVTLLFYFVGTGSLLEVAKVSVIVYTMSAAALFYLWQKKYI